MQGSRHWVVKMILSRFFCGYLFFDDVVQRRETWRGSRFVFHTFRKDSGCFGGSESYSLWDWSCSPKTEISYLPWLFSFFLPLFSLKTPCSFVHFREEIVRLLEKNEVNTLLNKHLNFFSIFHLLLFYSCPVSSLEWLLGLVWIHFRFSFFSRNNGKEERRSSLLS